MANCTSPCIGSNEDLLTGILNQDIAFGVRLSQVVQAFEISTGVPQSNQSVTSVTPVALSCSNAENDLLADILAQRSYNFNALQSVLLAV